jgi:DNA polymerase alpha subunit A
VEEVHEFLRQTAADVRANKLPIEQYTITKGLTKAPSEYPDAKNQPHVQVALQVRAGGGGGRRS